MDTETILPLFDVQPDSCGQCRHLRSFMEGSTKEQTMIFRCAVFNARLDGKKRADACTRGERVLRLLKLSDDDLAKLLKEGAI